MYIILIVILFLHLFQMEKLQALLVDPEALKFNFATFDPIPLPLDPEAKIHGIVSETALLFKVPLLNYRLFLFYVPPNFKS